MGLPVEGTRQTCLLKSANYAMNVNYGTNVNCAMNVGQTDVTNLILLLFSGCIEKPRVASAGHKQPDPPKQVRLAALRLRSDHRTARLSRNSKQQVLNWSVTFQLRSRRF